MIPDTPAAARADPPRGLIQVEEGVATKGPGPSQGPPCPPVGYQPGEREGEGVMKGQDTIRKVNRSNSIASGKFRQPPGSMLSSGLGR